MSTTAFPTFQLLLFLCIFVLIPALIGSYVFRDAKQRDMNAALWTLVSVFAPSLTGFILYLLVREKHSGLKCPHCETPVTQQNIVCPNCGEPLQPVCPNCTTPIEPDWNVCPRCAQPLPATQEDIIPPVHSNDKILWELLVAILVIPLLLVLSFIALFSAYR